MIEKIKSKLLTKLFISWVNEEFDVDGNDVGVAEGVARVYDG